MRLDTSSDVFDGVNANEILGALLCGQPVAHPKGDADAFGRSLGRVSAFHGVDALLHHVLVSVHEENAWSEELVHSLNSKVRGLAVSELAVQRELASLLGRLGAAEIEALLLKGTPLAYSIYPYPYLRIRGDTDLLIPEAQRRLASECLLEHGYTASEPDSREFGSYQLSYMRRDCMGIEHVVDLHWRLSNFQHFARVFDFRELADAAVSVENLSSDARALCPVHALMHACMHRAAHMVAPYFHGGDSYQEPNRLIWLYDIHLLADGFSENEWTGFSEMATSKELRAVCLDGLTVTENAFGTRIPVEVMDKLAKVGPPEPSARYLRPGRWRWKITELRALRTTRQRLALLGEWAFPPAGHMYNKYGVRRRWLLPLLYLRRAPGVLRLFRSPGKRD